MTGYGYSLSCQNVCAQILAQYDEESEREHIITQLQGELSHLGSLSKQILDNAQQIYGISENLAGSAEKGFNYPTGTGKGNIPGRYY
jgi:hypothetical protein